jgi:hypothetical protein
MKTNPICGFAKEEVPCETEDESRVEQRSASWQRIVFLRVRFIPQKQTQFLCLWDL